MTEQATPELGGLLDASEHERLEFKEARTGYSYRKLAEYSAALANEGGGRVVLGVTDSRPRRVVGTRAFQDPGSTTADLMRDLHVRVRYVEHQTADGRVLIFEVGSRPQGTPIAYQGRYLMRAGSSLVSMNAEALRAIIDETEADFSATVCERAEFGDLDPKAIETLRRAWARKTRGQGIENLRDRRLLGDLGLVDDSGVTYAALILLGRDNAVRRYLPDAEIVFEYRSTERPGPAQARFEARSGFLLVVDEVWDRINSRNEVRHIQDGLFIQDIPAFNEVVVREAFLNAVSHRDYRRPGSIFLRQYPDRLEIESPGGFPEGVTAENCIERQVPRNRLVAETLMKCGMVERAGQGMDRMFETSIREGKPIPSFEGTDEYHVKLTLDGQVRHPELLKGLEEIGRETLASFRVEDFLIVDRLYRNEAVQERYRERLHHLTELGVVERRGKGRGTKYVLARRLFKAAGKAGVYTRRRGLDRQLQKELLFKHIQDNRDDGSPLRELVDVVPQLSKPQIQTRLQELKEEGRIQVKGRTKGARWYPANR